MDDIVKKAVISRLISEGVSANNYTREKAKDALIDCVRAMLLIDYLISNEADIVKELSQIEQIITTDVTNIMQQFTATLLNKQEDMPAEFNAIVSKNLEDLI
jgi:hypothetical protein